MLSHVLYMMSLVLTVCVFFWIAYLICCADSWKRQFTSSIMKKNNNPKRGIQENWKISTCIICLLEVFFFYSSSAHWPLLLFVCCRHCQHLYCTEKMCMSWSHCAQVCHLEVLESRTVYCQKLDRTRCSKVAGLIPVAAATFWMQKHFCTVHKMHIKNSSWSKFIWSSPLRWAS